MMGRLFVLSRTWGYKDHDNVYRTQNMDGDYINALGRSFQTVTLGMVVVDPAKFSFVCSYCGRLFENIRIVPLRQTVKGGFFRKLSAQFHNFVMVAGQVRSANHVVVFMSSVSAVLAALFARTFNKKLMVYSGNDWSVDTALKLQRAPVLARKLAVTITDGLETLVLCLANVRLVNSPQLYDKCSGMTGTSERVRPVSRVRLADVYARDDTCQGKKARILYPAAVIPRKNHATLFQAIALLRSQGTEVELLLAGGVGSDQIMAELEKLAEELCIGECVRFMGYLAGKGEMLDLFRSADILVLPSLNEGFPRVVWEAMLQSLPCAVSRIPNIVADIGGRDVALMFNPLKAEEIADTLYRIISDGKLRRRLILKSRNYACEVFAEGWDEQLSRVLREWG